MNLADQVADLVPGLEVAGKQDHPADRRMQKKLLFFGAQGETGDVGDERPAGQGGHGATRE